jgi:hypothetical protein
VKFTVLCWGEIIASRYHALKLYREAPISFFTDLFEGKTGNLGKDITGMFRPNEIGQTLEGAAAVAAPFALGALAPAAVEAISGFGGALGFGEAAGDAAVAAAPAAGDAGTALADAVGASDSLPADAMGWAAPDASGGLPASFGGAPMTDWTAGAAQPAAGGGDFFSKLMSGVESFPGKLGDAALAHPFQALSAGAGLGALGYNLYEGQKTLPEQRALTSQANQLTQQGQQFMAYLQNGTLPAGLQAAVDRATASAKAQIIANAARNGMNTDPTQNTQLAQDLAAADRNAMIAVAQEGESLFQGGMSEIQLSSAIMERLMQVDQQQTASMGKAIANFASALSGPLSKAA